MRGVSFGLGLCVGAVISAVAMLLFAPPEVVEGAAAAPEVAVEQAERTRLQREVGQLQQRLRDLEAAQARQPAEGAPRAEAPTTPALTDAALLDELLRQLTEQLHTGRLRQHFATRSDELIALVLAIWTSSGCPERALDLLAALPEGSYEHDALSQIAQALLERGDRRMAAQVYLRGLRLEPESVEFVRALCDLDPAAALDVLEQELARRVDEPDLRTEWEPQRLALLLAAGRRDDALPLIDKFIADGNMGGGEDESWDFWSLLIRHAPDAAVDRLKAQLAKAEPEERAAWELQLARATSGIGDAAGAKRMVLECLQRWPDSDDALEQLGELDRAAAIAHAKARTQVDDGRETWQRLAQQYEHADRRDDAIAAYWEAWRREFDSELHDKLLQLAPERNLEPVLRVAREALAGRKDDLLGEIYGDAAKVLWQSGQRQRAIELWRHARQLDDEDSEWPDRLRRALAGQNPLD